MSQSLRRSVALITRAPSGVFQRDVRKGANAILTPYGFDLIVVDVNRPISCADDLTVAWKQIAGAMVISNSLPDPILEELYHQRHVPLSLISHRTPGKQIPGVMPNNRQGIALLVEHLVVDCGRTKPIFIGGDLYQNDGVERDVAFRQEVMRHNLNVPPNFILDGKFDPAAAIDAMTQFLADEPDFDAVVAADYLMARAILKQIRASGRKIPDDVGVVAFGDGVEAAQAGLTTVAADVIELGRRAARQLVGQIEGLRIRGLTLLSPSLIERATTRKIADAHST